MEEFYKWINNNKDLTIFIASGMKILILVFLEIPLIIGAIYLIIMTGLFINLFQIN